MMKAALMFHGGFCFCAVSYGTTLTREVQHGSVIYIIDKKSNVDRRIRVVFPVMAKVF